MNKQDIVKRPLAAKPTPEAIRKQADEAYRKTQPYTKLRG